MDTQRMTFSLKMTVDQAALVKRLLVENQRECRKLIGAAHTTEDDTGLAAAKADLGRDYNLAGELLVQFG